MPTSLASIKETVFALAQVSTTKELKAKNQQAKNLDLRKKSSWEELAFSYYAQEQELETACFENRDLDDPRDQRGELTFAKAKARHLSNFGRLLQLIKDLYRQASIYVKTSIVLATEKIA